MENFLEGGVAELEEARTAAANFSKKEQELKDAENALKAKQKEYELQQKKVSEKIASTIKKERLELEKEHENLIAEASKSVKDAEHQKKNAKSAAMNLRIQEETFDYVAENKRLAAENSDIMKKGKLPFFCKYPLYHAVFSPVSKKDYLFCGIGIIIAAGIIPFIVNLFLKTTLLKVLIWILIVLFFAAVYALVFIWTRKGSKNEYIKIIRPNTDKIADNKATIKKFNKDIKADPDESRYNLGAFDEKLERAKTDLNDKTSNRDAALKNFDEVRAQEIQKSIEDENADMLAELDKDVKAMEAENAAKNEGYEEAMRTMESFRSELGEKNMDVDKINELIGLINEGKAASIKEALEAQQNKGKRD